MQLKRKQTNRERNEREHRESAERRERTYSRYIQTQDKGKRAKTEQKRQSSRAENKARKKQRNTTQLFAITKVLQVRKKTQGKRQTLKIKYSQRKTNLQQITSKSKQVTASQTTCTKQQRKSHKTATHFPITKAKRTVNTQEENATSTSNVFKSV